MAFFIKPLVITDVLNMFQKIQPFLNGVFRRYYLGNVNKFKQYQSDKNTISLIVTENINGSHSI